MSEVKPLGPTTEGGNESFYLCNLTSDLCNQYNRFGYHHHQI